MKFKTVATIRIIGLAIAVDLQSSEYADKIKQKCRKSGLLFATQGQSLIFFPALNIDRKTAEKGLDLLEQHL